MLHFYLELSHSCRTHITFLLLYCQHHQKKDIKNYIVYIEYIIEVKVLYFHNVHYILYYFIILYKYIKYPRHINFS